MVFSLDEEGKEILIRTLGFILMAIGLFTALAFGGNQGFTAGTNAGAAYIGGFILAFIGAFFAFFYHRLKARRSEENE